MCKSLARDPVSRMGDGGRRVARAAWALVIAALVSMPSAVQAQAAANTAAPDAPSAAGATPEARPAPLAESLKGMARADYAAARILYEDGDYAGAFTKLESAYLASQDPRLLWNMAACDKELRHYANVLVLLERYLREAESLITPEEREATRQLVETVQAFVNELDLRVRPDGAEVSIDGVARATTPIAQPLRVDMGKRKLSVRKEGFLPYETELDLAGGQRLELEVQLEPERHEGTLRIVSDPSAVISIDGKVVGTATWVGQLPSGSHSVHVSAPGKQAHKTEVVIKDDATSSLHVNLVDEPSLLAPPRDNSRTLLWVIGGVALAGAGVGTYLLLRPSDARDTPELGTWGGFEL